MAERMRLGDVCRIESPLVDPRDPRYADRLHVGGANMVSLTGELVGLRTAKDGRLISGKYPFSPGDVLYSKIRPYLRKVAIPAFAGVCSADIYPLRPKTTQIDGEYLFYLLLTDDFTDYAIRVSNRAGMPKVNREQLFAYETRVPRVPEQRRIVARIKECMERIDEIRKLRGNARSESRHLESAMFHDFVMGEVADKDWPTASLGSITLSIKYGTSKKATTSRVGSPVLRMGNIVDGYLDVSDLKYVQLPHQERAKYRLTPGDILINRTNSLELVGKAATFDQAEGEWLYASYLVRVRVDRSRAIPEYVTAVINSRIGRDFVMRTARRAIGMVNINAKEMARFPIPLPPLPDQGRFVATLSRVRAAALQIRGAIADDESSLLRNAVLRKAFAGEL